ncbi:MAG: hypothetical protein D4R56_01595 [Deltaproteobacteria bacterium]|nr:MAG: hypothetical protein D4R56_01595 [Deltaproteobacteria bacterium]
MNTVATVPVRAATSIAIRQPRLVHYKIAAQKSLLKRFQHFIESTDWEERYLCNHWIDNMCLCGIVVSIIYFIPLLMSIIQE